ncbi:hypothetical protein QCD71_12250 [Sphingomonas sp. PsM26]|nr:hypothetical protein [Sphingomonas sp. PsM26]
MKREHAHLLQGFVNQRVANHAEANLVDELGAARAQLTIIPDLTADDVALALQDAGFQRGLFEPLYLRGAII